MHGFTLITFAALAAGLIAHAMKQYIAARRTQSALTLKAYYVVHWPESVFAVVCALALWGGLPELAALSPDLASSVGLTGEPGILSSFTCGFVGNSLADFIGGRAKAVTGSSS